MWRKPNTFGQSRFKKLEKMLSILREGSEGVSLRCYKAVYWNAAMAVFCDMEWQESLNSYGLPISEYTILFLLL